MPRLGSRLRASKEAAEASNLHAIVQDHLTRVLGSGEQNVQLIIKCCLVFLCLTPNMDISLDNCSPVNIWIPDHQS